MNDPQVWHRDLFVLNFALFINKFKILLSYSCLYFYTLLQHVGVVAHVAQKFLLLTHGSCVYKEKKEKKWNLKVIFYSVDLHWVLSVKLNLNASFDIKNGFNKITATALFVFVLLIC